MNRFVDNVLIITIDSLRANKFLDKQALESLEIYDWIGQDENGVQFDQAFATGPGTTPSFPGILTGTYPLSKGGFEPLTKNRPFIAQSLNSHGISTAGFTSNPFLSKNFNYDTGFDTFHDYQNPLMGLATRLFPRGIEVNRPILRKLDQYLNITTVIREMYQLVSGQARPYVSAEVITDDTISWIRKQSKPFFCWAHYMDVHHPCYPPESYREQVSVDPAIDVDDVGDLYSRFVRDPDSLTKSDLETLTKLYNAAIAYVNDQIIRIFDILRENKLWENTLIIVTSDHGELFGEHGEYAKPELLYDELIQVPLYILNAPLQVRNATDELVSLVDIPPLIHYSLGYQRHSDHVGTVPGIDEPREFVIAEHKRGNRVIVGARSQNWRFEVDNIRDQYRLYDLENRTLVDINKHTNCEIVEKLQQAVKERLNEIDIAEPEVKLESDVEDRLEDLGYLN